jgi:hypothetical protein
MRGLSLLQPWATLMAIGAKKIETRSWGTSYRGTVLIHASKGFGRDERELCLEPPFCSALRDAGVLQLADLPLGAVVAVLDLVDCIKIPDSQPGHGCLFGPPTEVRGIKLPPEDDEHAFGNYFPGRFAWVTENVRRLSKPIPWLGSLGLWIVPRDLQQQIHRLAVIA